MKMRSFLFVPGDSDRKFAKASAGNADVLICDLEDAVAPTQKEAARAKVAGWIETAQDIEPVIFVRVNPLDTDLTQGDLAAVVKSGLAGICLPKANGGDDVATVADMITPLEQSQGMEAGSVKIMVVATETPAAMFNLGTYAPAHPRLIGLTWGAEDLGAALGITANKDENGQWTFPFEVARAQCLFAAANAGVTPIDTLYSDFRDEAGLEVDCRKARRDGYVGRLAIHPAQIETINRCFTPSDTELAHAQRIVDAFAENPDAGTLGIDGKMYDIPHLVMAKKMLVSAG